MATVWVDPTLKRDDGSPVNFAGDYDAYLRYKEAEPALKAANIEKHAKYGYTDDDTYGAYSSAQSAAAKAIKKSIEQGTTALSSQKTGVNQTYDDLAKQAYAQYRRQQMKLPGQASNLATGTADSLALQGTLGYQNNLSGSERERANTLSSIDSDIAQLRASGDISLAENAEKYALMAEQYRQQLEQQAYERQLAAMQLAEQNTGFASSVQPKGETQVIAPATYAEAQAMANQTKSLSPLAAYWRRRGYTDGQIADMLNQYQVDP